MEASDIPAGALFLALCVAGAVVSDSVDTAVVPPVKVDAAATSRIITASDIHALLEKEPRHATAFDWMLEQAGLTEAPEPPEGWEYKEKKGMWSLVKKKH